jgi:5-methylcytosine-specific restriction endonuclease McrA
MKGKMPRFIPNNKGVIRSEKNKKKISETLKKKGIKPPRPPRESLCRGEKHRWWKGGISPINELLRKSPEYKLWRKSVFERDNYTCVWCGKKDKTIQADHIQEFSKRPDLRFAIDNGRTLCGDCHHKRHWGNEVESDINLTNKE